MITIINILQMVTVYALFLVAVATSLGSVQCNEDVSEAEKRLSMVLLHYLTFFCFKVHDEKLKGTNYMSQIYKCDNFYFFLVIVSTFQIVRFPNDACTGSSKRNGTCYTR